MDNLLEVLQLGESVVVINANSLEEDVWRGFGGPRGLKAVEFQMVCYDLRHDSRVWANIRGGSG